MISSHSAIAKSASPTPWPDGDAIGLIWPMIALAVARSMSWYQYADVIRSLADYTLTGRAQDIHCPTLLGSADDDPLSATTSKLRDALVCPVTAIHYTAADFASGHCEMTARTLVHRRSFDWLDETLGKS